MHSWHEKNNAVFVDAGVWLRPRYYKQGQENLFEGSKREAKNVRTNVGVCDVTTLGKIDIKGKRPCCSGRQLPFASQCKCTKIHRGRWRFQPKD